LLGHGPLGSVTPWRVLVALTAATTGQSCRRTGRSGGAAPR